MMSFLRAMFLSCMFLVLADCDRFASEAVPEEEAVECEKSMTDQEFCYDELDHGGYLNFKVPVPKGYDWEVSQSWSVHCEICEAKYDDWDYCSSDMSHTWDCCVYSWDFNLPGNSDEGKPVLASSQGVLREFGYDNGWGNYVVVEHGNDICTRYAHMLDDSTNHLDAGQDICQGLKLGEIGNTGGSNGAHLHFHFEDCESGETLEMQFTDGNGVPVCTRGEDVYDSSGNYNFLKLSNKMVEDCSSSEAVFGEADLDEGGWSNAACGKLEGCPLIPNCDRHSGHKFDDQSKLTEAEELAAAYLYGECALDGKANGDFDPDEYITRAEALKIAMFLFGLMQKCGYGGESFADVDQEDWFFEVVACGVKFGIVESANAYFYPNAKVKLVEAAKFVTMAAEKAGVIELKNEGKVKFQEFNSSYWGYKFLATLYLYGGLDSAQTYMSPETAVKRGDFAIMAASLSPCYCKNINCSFECACEQEVYACVDPNEDSSNLGGAAGTEEEEENEKDDSTEQPPDLEIYCFVDLEEVRCEEEKTILYIKCSVSNNNNTKVLIDDLVLSMTDKSDEKFCEVTDAHLDIGVGTKKVEAYENKQLSGHFEIACSAMPGNGKIEVEFDLIEKYAGKQTAHLALLDAVIDAKQGNPFSLCSEKVESDPEPDPPAENPKGETATWQSSFGTSNLSGGYSSSSGWSCNAKYGYQLLIAVDGGWFEAMASSKSSALVYAFPSDEGMLLSFACADLPGAIMIHPGDGLNMIIPLDEVNFAEQAVVPGKLPDIAVWWPYNGNLTINPPYNPDVIIGSVSMPSEYGFLVRIPAD